MTHTCVLVDSGGDGYGGYELVLVPVVLAVADLEPGSLLLVGGSVPGHRPVSLAGQRDRLPGLDHHLQNDMTCLWFDKKFGLILTDFSQIAFLLKQL